MQQMPPLSLEVSIPVFLTGLAQRLKTFEATEERINRKTAENFSPFHYIALGENMSSAIVADLLNPKGAHGQGRLFLDAFLDACGLDPAFFPPGKPLRVATEATTWGIEHSLRRMDILLTGGGNVLAVENKLYAGDQKEQVSDYLHHLEKAVAAAFGQFALVYLTPGGRRPSEYSLSEETHAAYARQIRTLSWFRLLECLEECRKQVDAEKLRFFLKDFISAIGGILCFAEGE